jgi:hypothetical protein
LPVDFRVFTGSHGEKESTIVEELAASRVKRG